MRVELRLRGPQLPCYPGRWASPASPAGPGTMDHQSPWVVRTVRAVLVRVVVGFFLLVAAMGIVSVVGIRRKSAAVVNAVRRLSRATKALPLKTAGTGDAYASVVRHVGRTSGKSYETPVHAVVTDDGFAIALPYGSGSDWVKNVLARRTAAIVYGGRTCPVDDPKIVPLAAATPQGVGVLTLRVSAVTVR